MVLLKGSQKITVDIGEVFFTSEGLRTPDMSLFRAKKATISNRINPGCYCRVDMLASYFESKEKAMVAFITCLQT